MRPNAACSAPWAIQVRSSAICFSDSVLWVLCGGIRAAGSDSSRDESTRCCQDLRAQSGAGLRWRSTLAYALSAMSSRNSPDDLVVGTMTLRQLSARRANMPVEPTCAGLAPRRTLGRPSNMMRLKTATPRHREGAASMIINPNRQRTPRRHRRNRLGQAITGNRRASAWRTNNSPSFPSTSSAGSARPI